MTELEKEILELLCDIGVPVTGYQLASGLEGRWKRQGRRSRLLFWTFSKILPFGTLYRALDHLQKQSLISRQMMIDDKTGKPRAKYSPEVISSVTG